MNYLLLFLAVAVGYGIAISMQKKQVKQMSIFLAFSGAFLLSMTINELLPEVFKMPTRRIGVFIMAGILLQIILEFFSKGAEHGHVHLHIKNRDFPWLLFISLSIHALLEGFPISESNDILIGIIVHKIPVAIILSIFFIQAQYSRKVTLSFLFLFALMTPLGNLLSDEVSVLQEYHTEITAVVIGIFLHVSTTILYESSRDHKFNMAKLLIIVLGFSIAYFF
ncbi:MAG: ZIP family metal transporter [Bacteroidia bacterium]|nr:ZIP family metal transporter [Bacteroidia bacterium]NNF29900.1 ZIP family metal transporter [Flavobacteriaceae bacterium]MBT8276884.1 ZIP family metal transporter [Bacteroidia bacterium]NNJ81614.1 ZIP family metal transporter [Flavobacteriaceae bacterium]NNK55038.1 ZIP family metal transporter [Flavobacteriaceae bacterium]